MNSRKNCVFGSAICECMGDIILILHCNLNSVESSHLVISYPNTVIDPRTMVVHFNNTSLADTMKISQN